MELQFHGANCFTITTKKARLVIDDNLSQLGLKSITKSDDILLQTSKKLTLPAAKFLINMPGEYEVSGVSIQGIPARAHMDKDEEKSAVIYTILAGELRLVVLGHIFPKLSDEQIEKIGVVDIALVPVGNSGYTMDGTGALEVIKDIEPKVVIPSHYGDKAIKYEVPQVELAEALKVLAMEPVQTVDKYRPKPADLTDNTQLVVLDRLK